MKTTMVGLVFLLLGSSTVSPTEPGIASQGSGSTFEHCCNDRQPGHLPIFRFDGVASYTTAIAASGDAADIYYPTDGSPAIFALLGDRFPVVVVLQGGGRPGASTRSTPGGSRGTASSSSCPTTSVCSRPEPPSLRRPSPRLPS